MLWMLGSQAPPPGYHSIFLPLYFFTKLSPSMIFPRYPHVVHAGTALRLFRPTNYMLHEAWFNPFQHR
jgi:hypothetical protein